MDAIAPLNNIVGLLVGLLTLIGIVIGVIAWFIRLESKVKYLEKDHAASTDRADKNYTVLWAKMDTMQQTQTTILQTLGRIDERTSGNPKPSN